MPLQNHNVPLKFGVLHNWPTILLIYAKSFYAFESKRELSLNHHFMIEMSSILIVSIEKEEYPQHFKKKIATWFYIIFPRKKEAHICDFIGRKKKCDRFLEKNHLKIKLISMRWWIEMENLRFFFTAKTFEFHVNRTNYKEFSDRIWFTVVSSWSWLVNIAEVEWNVIREL